MVSPAALTGEAIPFAISDPCCMLETKHTDNPAHRQLASPVELKRLMGMLGEGLAQGGIGVGAGFVYTPGPSQSPPPPPRRRRSLLLPCPSWHSARLDGASGCAIYRALLRHQNHRIVARARIAGADHKETYELIKTVARHGVALFVHIRQRHSEPAGLEDFHEVLPAAGGGATWTPLSIFFTENH